MQTTSMRMVVLFGALLWGACGDDDAPADAGTDAARGAEACEVIAVFERRCALGGCHLPHNPRTELVLTRDAVEAAGLDDYVVPGDPEGSRLFQRMTDGSTGPLMPLGQAEPIPEVEQVRAWIAAGASTRCDVPDFLPDLYDPNHLDPEALFECATPTVDASAARIRRVERREWTHAVVKPVSVEISRDSNSRDNPLETPRVLPYSTYARGVTVDPTTLELLLLVLPEAPAIWSTNDPQSDRGEFVGGGRTVGIYNNRDLRCIHEDPAPADACIDRYLDTLLRRGTLFRAPSDDETGRLRARLVRTLGEEAGDITRRKATLNHVGQAAYLMAGSLFRSELGEPVAGDAAGRRRLTPDEMALAVGHVFSSHPTGTPVSLALASPHPDADALLGRMSAIRAAADDGAIYDEATLRRIFEAYQGGEDPTRQDLFDEADTRRIAARGEFWIAENFSAFFREWLDYAGANSAFKDTPGGTGRYGGPDRDGSRFDRTTGGFANLQSGYYGKETTLVDQLDDTIARIVVESHERGEDVFAALFTSRMWRLPSNLSSTNGVPCTEATEAADCTAAPFTNCTSINVCGNSIAGLMVSLARVYGREDIPATPEGRWVEVPASERMGVLTHPAWLAAHGGNFEDDASAVRRGRWIREQLFCETVPGLDLVSVPATLIPSDPSRSARQRLVTSVEDPDANPFAPTCMGCHELMNPLGFPFEIYNHAGFVRAYDHGPGAMPLDPSGASTITLAPDVALIGEVRDAIDLSQRIAASRVARRCFIRHAFRYFTGRNETEGDACTLSAMESSLDADGSFFTMIRTLVASDTFQMRTLEEQDR